MQDKKAVIFEAGRELFQQKGFKDINVSDITKKAGVGVGTFYNYYESKEQLFLEIFIDENSRVKRATVKALNFNDTPDKIIRDYMQQSLNIMSNNMILKEWYKKDMARELRAYFNEHGGEDVSFVRSVFIELLAKWRAEKSIREDLDIEAVLSIFDMLVYLDNHQDEVGIADFPSALRLLGEFIIQGITAR